MNIEPIRSRLEKSSLFAHPPKKNIVVGRDNENNPEKKIVIGRGNENNPEFLIFGEAPGKQENKAGIPFVGRAGKILDGWIKAAGIEDKCYISNVIPFMPLDKAGKIRKPSFSEVEEYRFFKDWVIKQVSPTFIITLGDSATWSISNILVRSLLGKTSTLLGGKMTAIYHPIYYSHRGVVKKGREDFINAVKLLRNI